MKPHCHKRILHTATLAALVTAFAANSHAARLDGRVSDGSGSRFLGAAIVSIPELKLQTTTTSDGRYSFPDVPAGSYTLEVDYVGAEKVTNSLTVGSDDLILNVRVGEDLPPIENVLVWGQKGQQASAINQQRANDNITSVITAGDAGVLPDANIAEALQRAPGVFIARDQGEGRFVAIRGLEPSLSTVKINGVNLAAPDSNQRAVALDVIPSDLLENLEITKTFTPDQDGDAIGGTIEVRSLSGFDRDGQFVRATVEGGYNDLVEEYSPKIAATYSNVFDVNGEETFAIAGSLSYQERDFGSYNLEHDGGFTAAENGFLYPEEPEYRDYVITRERFGAALNLDWRPTFADQYYIRTLYSDFEDEEIRNRIEIEPDEDSATSIREFGADFDGAEYTRSLKDRIETQEILSLVIGGQNERGPWSIDYSVGYSYAEEDEPNRIDTDFAGADDVSLSYTALGQIPRYTIDDMVLDPAFFELDEIVVENNLVEDEELSFTLDVTRQMDFAGNPGSISFGVKARQREKDRESDIDVYDDFGDDAITAEGFAGGQSEWDLRTFGFTLNRGALRNFTRGLTDDNLNADDTLVESTVGDYSIDEDIYAGYAMATVDFDQWRIIGGVRYELTEFESEGAIGTVFESESLDVEEAGFGRTKQDGDYDHFLPSLVVRWDTTDELVMRFAASQTIARPSFGALNPSSLAEVEEEDGETELQIEDLGNPDLDPYESINVDFSAEWYPGDNIGVLSAAVFYKDISEYIAFANVAGSVDLTQWTDLVPSLDADAITDADVLQFVNADDAEVFGIELSWYYDLPLGFLVGLNATFTDTEATFDGRDVDLPGSSDEIGNLILGYENFGLQARLAVNYKSEALAIVGGDASEDVIENEHLQVDASIIYNVTDNVQVYFEGVNLTDEEFYLYQGDELYNWQYEEYGRSYLFGVRLTGL